MILTQPPLNKIVIGAKGNDVLEMPLQTALHCTNISLPPGRTAKEEKKTKKWTEDKK